ncbi:hypothetical protein [Streptomyces sp. BE147]|uniref:hypothetical protein n=1 Tax=unclassified Streptomyces TaxID=2593676 RepID=UPI002E77E529|nr:hypothetical protein [Streptomyces sp. BE147]MEE1736159.1 hypothetical protein [Streptomyces sp. BE147]
MVTREKAADGERLRERQDRLQREADAVEDDLGLAGLLSPHGRVVRVGSAALGLMVVADLDLTVVCPRLNGSVKRAVTAAGATLGLHERVRQVTFRDDTGEWNTDPAYPDGLYLNVAYRTEDGQEWTLDIWFVDEPDRQPDLAHVRDLPPRLTAAHRADILAIKQALSERPAERRVPSYEVYRAVLDYGVGDVAAFDDWCARERG